MDGIFFGDTFLSHHAMDEFYTSTIVKIFSDLKVEK